MRALPIHLIVQTLLPYRLATMRSVTDRQTDRRHYGANSRSVREVRWLNANVLKSKHFKLL